MYVHMCAHIMYVHVQEKQEIDIYSVNIGSFSRGKVVVLFFDVRNFVLVL